MLVAFFALALKLLPFRIVAARSPVKSRRTDVASPQRIGALVDRAGRMLRATCMPRALALARILASRGIPCELRLGVRRSGSGLAAHAWVSGGGGVLIGGAGTDEYYPLLTLPNHP